ncbi:broad specificity phosphatase PhoE [Tumebacillus sp. BK434]|uniref:histidine phosphatase family protein n=1 Tax=Tumebacillus sp. BK434 TaxID=2512169 RepID=UPI001050BE9B|nr:histidine phosphatase family protein [Tumebacillus sp. BK434]TCP54740.1 broad specificity phosphatase PhoE [Tumebacillus sp. BK434]
MSKLYVVRHAQVEIDPKVPAHLWQLSSAGVHSTRELAARESWAKVRTIWHSPEPKAVGTARVIAEQAGLVMKEHAGLHELAFDAGYLSQEEFQSRVGAYFQGGTADPAFEPYHEAEARIAHAVQDIVARSNGQDTAIVSHGRILTVLYSRLLGRRLGPKDWRSIQLPDLSVIDTTTWNVERGFLCSDSH